MQVEGESLAAVALAAGTADPAALSLAGAQLMAAGDLAAAEPLLAAAARLSANDPDCLLAYGNLRCRRGDATGAAELWRAALAIDPGHGGACCNLAGLLRAQGAWQQAAQACQDALRLRPMVAELWVALAASLLAGSCLDAALTAADAALELDAAQAEAWLVRGTVLSRRRSFDAALPALRQAVALDPGSARAVLHLGNALLDLDRLDAAEVHLRMATDLDPGLAEAQTSLGFLLSSRGRLADALACHDRAIALRPDFADAHSNRAAVLLMAGDFARGWAAYEWRKHNPLFAACYWASDRPEWRGEPLAGRTLLVFCEQGFGDSIFCARFLPQLAAGGAAIVLVCAPPLIPLLSGLPGVVAVVPRGEPRSGQRTAPGALVPSYDAWIDQLSLPLVLGAGRAPIVGAGGYLQAAMTDIDDWRLHLPPGLKVGLAWSGNPAHSNDHRRSTTLRAIAPILAVAPLTFVSLQLDDEAQAAAAGLQIVAERLTDYAQTAALLACLDLVICVDTSVAHLAGALGRPVWLMLPYAAEWRWRSSGVSTPWYGSMRLFRQPTPGAWQPLVAEIAVELAAWVSSHASRA